jgi:hypothetical protein
MVVNRDLPGVLVAIGVAFCISVVMRIASLDREASSH